MTREKPWTLRAARGVFLWAKLFWTADSERQTSSEHRQKLTSDIYLEHVSAGKHVNNKQQKVKTHLRLV